jgi:phosphate acetyltransferase
MYLPALGGATPRTLAFADCALSVDPNDRELADIAVRTARSFEAATGQRARVALLSFSTMGSGSGEQVDKVRRATALAQAQAPDVMIAGELQFDTAFVPAVAEQKGVVSDVAGQANVFVFPNLEAGNIGYKIAQRLGGALAIGPILQGLAKPANDLSRGATSEDILAMIEVTARQAKEETPLVPTSIFEEL